MTSTLTAPAENTTAPTTTGSPSGCPVPPPRARWGALLRVSDSSRKKFQSTLADDLDWLTWNPQAAWVKANVTDVVAFTKGPAGDVERARLGMTAVYAEGTDRLIGARLERNGWIFLFLLTTAAKADLPSGGNSATEAIRELLLALRTYDPHDRDDRSWLYAHALDRLLRNETFAWQTYDSLVETYVLIDAAGTVFDALSRGAKSQWTLISYGASQARDETARKFLIKRLNMARSGDNPGNENALPHGFRASAEPDQNGLWNLDPKADPRGDKRIVRRPEPDPRERWLVQRIAELFDSPASYADIALTLGAEGVMAKGTTELDVPLSQMSDLNSAGKHRLSPQKIRAYVVGLLAHPETGVTPGEFSPGDNHMLLPRYEGDVLGAVSYDVRVGLPEDVGWSWDVPRSRWQSILERRYLPLGWRPTGWSWSDDEWDWTDLFAACETRRTHGTGSATPRGGSDVRPLSGVLSWTHDDGSRHGVFAKTGTDTAEQERYEWRRQAMTQARRDSVSAPYAMTSRDGVTASSWRTSLLHAAFADMLEEAVLQRIDDGAVIGRLTPPPPSVVTKTDPAKELRREHAAVAQKAAQERADAEGYGLRVARALRADPDADVSRLERKEREAEERAKALDTGVQVLWAAVQAAGPGDPQQAVEVADFGEVAAVIGALRGAFASGPAPIELNDAMRRLLRGSGRLAELDAATADLRATFHLPDSTGTRLVTLSRRLGRSRLRYSTRGPAGGRVDGSADDRTRRQQTLVERYWLSGCSLDELLHLAQSDKPGHWLDLLTRGAPAGVTHPGLRRTLTQHPLGIVRTALSGGTTALDADMTQVLTASYTGPGPWKLRGPFDPSFDNRIELLSVMAALPDPTRTVSVQDLGLLSGIPVRHVATISDELHRGQWQLPATLHRPGAWTGRGPGKAAVGRRLVALHACPWADCDSPVADGLCLLPEVVLGCSSTVLCRCCLRPPTRSKAFPEVYRTVLTALVPGSWVRCTRRGCDIDLGAGPGLLWRWSTATTPVPSHPAC